MAALAQVQLCEQSSLCSIKSVAPLLHGRFLSRLCDLVGAPRGRPGPFFRLPGRGGHMGGPATKWGGPGSGSRGGAPGGAALTFAPGRAAGAVFFQGGSLRDKWLDRAGAVCPSWARKK